MVVLNRIYTRTGDRGRTGLVGGARVGKADRRIEAIGAVDELNAQIGLARLAADRHTPLAPILARIQNDLFDLGADLATPAGPLRAGTRQAAQPLRIVATQVARLEAEIDALNADLPALKSFVLPGGGEASAALHLARTVCRRAERRAVAGVGEEPVHAEALRYLNRLSDLLFVAARFAASAEGGDRLWVPGAHG